MDPNDEPLGQSFYQNPLEYMQNYVRNMNNELFLSQYQINYLYALLLIGRSSPWDNLKPNSFTLKMEVDCLVEKKVTDVKFILDNLSQLYQDKVKKSTLNQIQRLMAIIRAQNKSIYIQKIHPMHCNHHQHSNHQHAHQHTHQQTHQHAHQQTHQHAQQHTHQHTHQHTQQNYNHTQSQEIPTKHKNQQEMPPKTNQNQEKIINNKEEHHQQNTNQQSRQHNEQHQSFPMSPFEMQQNNNDYEKEGEADTGNQNEVFHLFYGLANIGKMSQMAMNDALEYNHAQRYIKFKMSKNYTMTIKNDDPNCFDLTSKASKVPADIFINHIFPYLTASELFTVRSVCRQWLDYVKEAWHATFKRQMFVQLLACQFCKDIQFFYKLIQLRNPFFQKISLLLHALIEIIQWETVYDAVNNNTIQIQLKRVLIVLLKLIGQPISIRTVNDITDNLWEINKPKVLNLKNLITTFFSNLNANTDLSIDDLRNIKTSILDHPFMRVEQMNTEDKTPLLLSIFIKQLTLQQIIRCHIFFSQQYLLNSKKRLDIISQKMPPQRGYLEGVYKILLLKSMYRHQEDEQDQSKAQLPNFHQLLQSIFNNQQTDKPDFVIRGKNTLTNIFIDRATKLDIIVSTVKKMNLKGTLKKQEEMKQNTGESQQGRDEQKIQQEKNQKKESLEDKI